MGCTSSYEKITAKKAAEVLSKKIDRDLLVEESKMSHEIKILLLGAGESGKSTIVKQMKIIHGGGYSVQERLNFRHIIYNNTLQSIITIIKSMGRLDIPFSSPVRKRDARLMFSLAEEVDETTWSEEVGDLIKRLWLDEGVRSCFERSREYQLNDSAEYFLNSLDRLNQKDYVPTQQDVLRMRVKTTGVVETTFSMKNVQFRMIDIGGQRTERKKWMHCFDGVTAIIFLVALSEYDQMLAEDQEVNRMVESLKLFESISTNSWFHDTAIILFLNKIDIFTAKLTKSPLSVCFPDYTDGDTYDEASEFILDKFQMINYYRRDIYPHFTCATDTSNIDFVMRSVSDIIIKLCLLSCDVF